MVLALPDPEPIPGAATPSGGWRRKLRTAIRAGMVLFALVWCAAGAGVMSEVAGQISAGEMVARGVFYAATGIGPLLSHIWWSRTHPLPGAPVLAPAPRPGLLGRLDQLRAAADELHGMGWLSAIDRRAVHDRAQRLEQLALADDRAIALGGAPSGPLAQEVAQLHGRLTGLLDAAVDSAAVAPGDAGLDDRLQAQLDAVVARGHAIGELEGRPRAAEG